MATPQMTKGLAAILGVQPVMPVLKIDDLSVAVPLAKALVRGGLRAIEITLRSPQALDAIRLVASDVPDAIVGAGTILSSRDYDKAIDAGAKFIVSPGTTVELLDRARLSDVPFLPGASTPSEIMSMREEGYSFLKFFPAQQSGGASYLKSIAGPISDIKFCPTGGISPQNALDYLSLPNVVCVGGSWVAPQSAIDEEKWDVIEALARDASQIGK